MELNREFFVKAGQRGGNRTKETQPKDFFSRIGKKGGRPKKRKKV